MYWLNVLIGDIKNNITGIYHGVTKRDLPLFLNEREWRFNHDILENQNKIQKYFEDHIHVLKKQLLLYSIYPNHTMHMCQMVN